MRNEQIINERKARGRLLAVLCTALFVLASWGLPRFPAKAETPQASNTGSSQAEKPGEPPSAGQALGRKTDQFRLSKEAYRKAVAYSKAWYRLYFVSVGWSILVLWLLLRLGVVARLRDFAERRTGSLLLEAVIFVPGLLLLLGVLRLPIGVYGHGLSLRYQQSIQRWGSWF